MQKSTLRFGELDIPIAIIEAFQQNRLVVFVGAGVSMGAPTNLMNFEDLTQLIITANAEKTPSALATQIQQLDINDAFKKQLIDAARKAQYRSPEERLGEAQDSGKIDIKAQCLHHLKDDDLVPNHLHHQIIRLFAQNPVRIITTNFENMLQKTAKLQDKAIKTISIAPNLPQGDVVEGIVHLHGSLEEKESIILSDRDFGRAYLTEGWARRFITRVFSQYTVLFIGYSYNDTIMKYLTRSTSQKTTQKLFGISSVNAENQEVEARRWDLLGMTHIPYVVTPKNGHQALNTGIEALADCLNWRFSEQQAQIQQLVQDIEGRPVNLLDTDWQYLHYFYSKSELLNYFLLQIQHPAWPNILEQLQSKYPQSSILLQQQTAFTLLDRFWYQSTPTMMRLFQKYYANAQSCRTVLYAFDQALANKKTLEKNIVQQWLHLLIPHIDNMENSHLFLIEPTSKHIAPFLLQHNCHQELESIFRQFLLLNTHFDSSNPANITFEYNIDEHSLEDLLHYSSSFMQLPPTTILDICIHALKQHTHLLNVFSTPNQDRYDAPTAIQFYKPCIWKPANGHPKAWQKMAYQLVDACHQVLMRPEMSTAQTWAWANEYLSQKNVLLQKLALYIITHHADNTADDKFTLVANTLDMHALDFHAEIFDFFEHCLMDLSDANIQLIIASLNHYPNQDDGHCVRWVFWLKQCHATDSAIDAYYQQQKQLHPHYQLSDNPYLHISIGEARIISPRSPYPLEQLLAQQDAAWFDELLIYDQHSWDGSEPDTEGLWQEINQACQQNPDWAMAFIQHAIDTQQNTKQLNQIISGFAQWQFVDLKQWDACFEYFQTLPMKQYSGLLCNLIDQTHRNQFFKSQPDSVIQSNRLVSTLLQQQAIDSESGFSSTHYASRDHTNVYNSNIGYVTSYLIMAFEKSIQAQNMVI